MFTLSTTHSLLLSHYYFFFFFFNDTATTEIYTLSLHDALPISHDFLEYADRLAVRPDLLRFGIEPDRPGVHKEIMGDRKSTRLNSSHSQISYAVFCLKKKKTIDVKGGCGVWT